MANDVKPTVADGVGVCVSTLSADFDFSAYCGGQPYEVLEIKFFPGAAGEYVDIRHGSATGAILFHLESIDKSTLKDVVVTSKNIVPGQRFEPYLKISDCSVASGTARVAFMYGILAG